jgi:hypothetical protein
MACEREDIRKYEYIKKNKEAILILFLEDDISFTQKQIDIATRMWEADFTLEEISKKVRPNDGIRAAEKETFLLLYELAEQGKIKKRQGGIFGSRVKLKNNV